MIFFYTASVKRLDYNITICTHTHFVFKYIIFYNMCVVWATILFIYIYAFYYKFYLASNH